MHAVHVVTVTVRGRCRHSIIAGYGLQPPSAVPQLERPGVTIWAWRPGICPTTRRCPADQLPRNARDFLDPRYTDKLAIAWPNDDDAVRFLLNLIDRYGWSYLDGLLAQRPRFVRGLQTAAAAVTSGRAAATIRRCRRAGQDPNSPSAFTLPGGDFCQSWAQTAAIFAKARHPAAAKLCPNRVLSKPFQQTSLRQWSVR